MVKIRFRTFMLGSASLLAVPGLTAQISLSTAVDLALRSDPKVKMAEADVAKAQATLAESKDVYIPAVSTSGGYGKSAGVPLGLPVIFSIQSQSLLYGASQPDYIRAARAGLESAKQALLSARSATVEDATSVYVSLDNALGRKRALDTQGQHAAQLVKIASDRLDAGFANKLDLTRDRRTAAEVRLQTLSVQDEIEGYADHLARLTGLPALEASTVTTSIPTFPPPMNYTESISEGPGVAAQLAIAQSKQYTASGDRKYLFRPQVGLAIGYSRITVSDTESNYGVYYPNFNSDYVASQHLSLNALSIGFQITVPIIDYLHRARAREASADAARAFAEAQSTRMQFLEGRHKLHRTTAELAARTEIAVLDRDLAQQQLQVVQAQLTSTVSTSSGTQLTPEDEAKAQMDISSREYDLLNAELQLRQTEISLMRQNGTLSTWLQGAISAKPADATLSAPAQP